jgi:hypothetical protein
MAAGVGEDVEQTAQALLSAIDRGRDFMLSHGRLAGVLLALKRVLPERWLVRIMARRAERAGYLDALPPSTTL